jgi:hypothetical protein
MQYRPEWRSSVGRRICPRAEGRREQLQADGGTSLLAAAIWLAEMQENQSINRTLTNCPDFGQTVKTSRKPRVDSFVTLFVHRDIHRNRGSSYLQASGATDQNGAISCSVGGF